MLGEVSETGGGHRASWRPGSAEREEMSGPQEVWRGVGGEGEEGVWQSGSGRSGGGGFTAGKRRSVSCAKHDVSVIRR